MRLRCYVITLARTDAPIYPVGYVQSTVCTEGRQIMGGDCFRFTSPLEHEELRQDSDSFEEDGEGPGQTNVVRGMYIYGEEQLTKEFRWG